jgi:hypothetical protein
MWQIPTIESLVFKILGNFQNYKFLEDWTKIPCFIYGKHYKVNKGVYMSDVEKILCKTKLRWGRNGWPTLTIQSNSTQDHPISSIGGGDHHYLGLFSALLCFVYLIWVDPSHIVLRFVEWAKRKIGNGVIKYYPRLEKPSSMAQEKVWKCEKNGMSCPLYHRGVSFYFLASYIVGRRNNEVANHIGLLWHLNVNHKTNFISSDLTWIRFCL